jgi:histone acetyltransferase (RNA polymerase elongator complex component)
MTIDIENTVNKDNLIPDEKKLKLVVKELIDTIGSSVFVPNKHQIDLAIVKLRRKYRVNISKNLLRYIYEKYYRDIQLNNILNRYLIKKACRSRSGVLVCTVVLRPDVFSCPKKCSYCPTETDLNGNPTQPKSYLSSEPAMLRAVQYNFDVKGQIWDRLNAYAKTGNINFTNNSNNKSNNEDKASYERNRSSYKLEIILSGGTWESYPYAYRNSVMNEIYYAANTFNENSDLTKLDSDREIRPIEDEINENTTANFRVIGLTIETRPDFVTKASILDYRRWGVTRVQIGVQHYNDRILEGINRECYTRHTIAAIRKLKQCGFKIVCHLMPDLPGSSPELDRWMFREAINNPLLQFDDVKIYPTAVCQSSRSDLIVRSDISDWYAQGKYVPYSETNLRDLINVLKEYKTNIQPWIRIQRLVRDIPKQSIEAGYDRISNLRQVIHDEMKKEGSRCRCIRCMEIGEDDTEMRNATLVVRPYEASEGKEYFVSYESYDKFNFSSVITKRFWCYVYFLFIYYFMMLFFNTSVFYRGDDNEYTSLIGFCRLRLDTNPGGNFIRELKDCALIREVHVYGHSLGVGSNDEVGASQHKGYGKNLVQVAETIALQNGYKKVAVIAGVGTREYYRKKCGYKLVGTYMIKDI